jgi:hypothetical protein
MGQGVRFLAQLLAAAYQRGEESITVWEIDRMRKNTHHGAGSCKEASVLKEALKKTFTQPYRTRRGKQVRFVFVDFGNGRAMRIYTRAFRSFGKSVEKSGALTNIMLMVEYYATCRFQLDAYGERVPVECRQWEAVEGRDLPELFGCTPSPLIGRSNDGLSGQKAHRLHRMKLMVLVQEMKRISRMHKIGGSPIVPGIPYAQTLFSRFAGIGGVSLGCVDGGVESPERQSGRVVRWNNRNIPKPHRG